MSRVQLVLRVADLEGSVAFYSKLFGAEPAKRRPGYANFAIEVRTVAEVTAATVRLAAEGLATATEENTACCYAVQDKVWVTGPGDEPWEVYVVKGDADALDQATVASPAASACC
jgi:catechol 2,3-dioxygenase-like lactoylglutathione lyase family enzyme